jgi:hypothetical protein
MANASVELQVSIQQLYEVFSSYPVAEKMDVCPCGCNRAARVGDLYAKPLRELERDQLDFYAFCALTTMGNETDFKHFLPRILELSVAVLQDLRLYTDFEVITGKLSYTRWRRWPEPERLAIQSFFQTLWRDVLNEKPEPEMEWEDTEKWLCAIAQAEDDLTPYLAIWVAEDSLEADLALTGLLLQSAVVRDGGSDRNAFWNRRDDQYQQLRQWVRSPAVEGKLERSAEKWAKTGYEEEFLAAWAIVT